MTDLHALAIRFADLWAVDHHQMVDEIYAPSIHMESMARLGQAAVDGSDQLHTLEDHLASLIPAHRHELVRVVAEERRACLETTVVAPETGEYAPACVCWWPDDRGQVFREVGWFDWELRSIDSRRSHGFVPPNDHRRRGDRQWYLNFAEALASGLTADPAVTVARSFASDGVIEQVGDFGARAWSGLPWDRRPSAGSRSTRWPPMEPWSRCSSRSARHSSSREEQSC